MLVDYKAKISKTDRRQHIGLRCLTSPTDPETGARAERVIKPGVQEIPDAEWAMLRQSAAIAFDEESGDYKGPLVATGQLVPLAPRFDIAKIDVSTAEAMIERTSELKILKAWLSKLQRQGPAWEDAIGLLEKQIETVTTDVNGNPAKARTITLPATASPAPPPAA